MPIDLAFITVSFFSQARVCIMFAIMVGSVSEQDMDFIATVLNSTLVNIVNVRYFNLILNNPNAITTFYEVFWLF